MELNKEYAHKLKLVLKENIAILSNEPKEILKYGFMLGMNTIVKESKLFKEGLEEEFKSFEVQDKIITEIMIESLEVNTNHLQEVSEIYIKALNKVLEG